MRGGMRTKREVIAIVAGSVGESRSTVERTMEAWTP